MATDYKALLDILKPKEEEPMMSEMAPADYENMQSPVVPEMLYSTPKLADALPAKPQQPEVPMLAEADTQQQPLAPETPMSKSQALLAEYNKMLGKDQQSLEEARKSDRILKVGGALGDALATYLNARSQMNVKAPGVQVQQGAGLGKIADMFATAPEIASDVATRREALMRQYAELARGERAQTRMDAQKEIAQERNKALKEAAQIRAGAKGTKSEFTPYQEKMLGEKQEEKVRKLSSEVSKSGLPRLTTSIKELESQLGMPLEKALSLNTDTDKTNDVNIPGYGRLASLAPDWSIGETQRAFRQGVQAVLNPDISKQYGATQSAGEIERYQKQIGGGNFEDQNAVLRGLVAIKTAAQSDLSAIQAGYDPKLVEKYQERKGVTLDTTKKEGTFPKTVTNKKTKETATVENEQELKEALAEGFE